MRPLEQAPGRAARFGPLEVARVHPLALVVELPDAVVPPGYVEAAHEEEVVAPRREVVERVGRTPEVHLVEELRRVGVRVAEQQPRADSARQSSYQHWRRAIVVNSSLVQGASGSRPISV